MIQEILEFSLQEKEKKVWIFGILISHVMGKAQEFMLAIQL